MQKVIWSYWFDGRDSAPELVQRCLASWEIKNPGWDVRCLDEYTVGRYVDLGSHVNLAAQQITADSLSDIIRVLLLHEFGGVWVDPTVLCNQPLDEWLPAAASAGFFAFSYPAPDQPLASWFLAAAPGNTLLGKWAAKTVGYWDGRSKSTDFFWFEHQFGELCSLDPEARRAWAAVPKISADGPNSLQWSKMLYEPFAGYEDDVDWMSPVFTLPHRVNDEDCHPGCLLHRVLYADETPPRRTVPDEPATSDRNAPMRFAGLKVDTENLGDHIQLMAANRLLGRLGILPDLILDRDAEIASAPALEQIAGPVGILMNGWFKYNPAEWPPHPRLDPVYLGFHIRSRESPTLLGPAAVEHYQRFGPIGCRDPYTASILKHRGVDAFVSHCLSLLYDRRLVNPETQTETYVVSPDRRIYRHIVPEIGHATFISHLAGSCDFDQNLRLAESLIATYRNSAKLIVTTMLHCALPAIAMGIPVVVFHPLSLSPWAHTSDRERFSALEQLVPVFHASDMNDIDWNGYQPDVSSIKLRLLDSFYEMAQKWSLPRRVKLGPIAPCDTVPTSKPAYGLGRNPDWAGRIRRTAADFEAENYFSLGDFVNARASFARRVEMGGPSEHTYHAMYRLAESMSNAGSSWPDTQDAYLRAWEFRPSRAEPLYAIARRYREAGHYRLGYLFASRAAEIPLPEGDEIISSPDIYTWRTTVEQAVCASWIGKHAEAFTLWRRLLARPDLPNTDRNRIAANRDVCVPTMLETASSYPDKLVQTVLAGRGETDVVVTLIAGPNLTDTEHTLNSFLNCCTDISRIGRFLVLDAELSTDDRKNLHRRYGFLDICPPGTTFGQLRDQIHERFWLHLGEGWRFFAPENLITRLTAVLHAEPQVSQVAINLNDATTLTATSAPEHTVRRAPHTGRYLLTHQPAHGPAMTDTTRPHHTHTATLDEVLCITAS